MSYIQENPGISFLILVGLALVASPMIQKLIGRMALRIAIRTETVVDDLIVDALRPFRFVYALPAYLGFAFSDWAAR